jgi:hypothetical protein
MYANWTTSNKRVIYIDNVNNNPTNWGEWLSSNESITLKYYAANGKEMNGIAQFQGGPPSSFVEFSTSASMVEVTHMKIGSTYKCYYSTCAGECGTLF